MSHSELIARMAWEVIRAITKGEKLENAMHTVFNLVYNWMKDNNP